MKAILRAMFLRCYATSLGRPWLKSAGSAFDDARYRLSIPLAAPFVVLVAVVTLIVRSVNPAVLSGRMAALLICFSLILGGLGTYLVLGRLFKSCLETPEVALQFDQPMNTSEIILKIALWMCVGVYCLLMIFV